MALRKPTEQVASAPAFETEEDDTETVAPAATAAPAPATQAPEEAQPADKAPQADSTAAPGSGQLVSQSKSAASEFAETVRNMKGAADFTYGNYVVFKADSGEIRITDGSSTFGRWVKVRMIAWDEHSEVSPNDKNPKSKDFVAYSKDGITIDSVIGDDQKIWIGREVQDYLSEIRQDFPHAAVRKFVDVAGYVYEADREDNKFIGEVVQFSLSPTSIQSFGKYQESLVQKARMVEMGIPIKLPADPFTFYFLREAVSNKGNSWTKLTLVDKLPKNF